MHAGPTTEQVIHEKIAGSALPGHRPSHGQLPGDLAMPSRWPQKVARRRAQKAQFRPKKLRNFGLHFWGHRAAPFLGPMV